MIEGFKDFLISANKNGYASGNVGIKEPDRSKTIEYSAGDFVFHDNFFGGEPYGGREVVFYKDKPYWIMVYYGYVLEGNANDEVYAFLQNALEKMDEDFPARGPKRFEQKGREYLNVWNGTLNNFKGEEIIKINSKLVYSAWYAGGLIDQ